jgi:hypothetical protein
MQELKEIKGTDYMSRSREVINNNFKSVVSNFSGQSFPTVNLEASMICYRTDQDAFFMLREDLKTWEKVLFIVDGKVYAKESVRYGAGIPAVDEPVKEFSGMVIAIIHRLNAVEDKLVVAPSGTTYSKEEIKDPSKDVLIVRPYRSSRPFI